VVMTGKALVFEKERSTWQFTDVTTFCSLSDFFVDGIHVSLFQNVVVSLIPNLLPLMITAGLMGYFGIPLNHPLY
jgi:predicted RND superfamily exporter protein